ncbi:acyltransferase family protein [Mucilaginibacter ginsenosidivorans]|uniref:Acyltransferase family protein n=1 Tax=Mucilaginibacter ginsenosidivorans TaxID=398053 RepID=A0A5B8V174_9SPHI|nr:acyltransferase family protein [Mucilaginibacter ginsenosidivorans]
MDDVLLFLSKLLTLENAQTATPEIPGPQTIDWINNLKVISLFAVIVLHTASLLLMDFKNATLSDWFAADLYNALTRFAVPVFVMITGALLLHREYEIGDFLKRRLSRIIWPFLFWSLVYIGYSLYDEEIVFTSDVWKNVLLVLHQLKYGAYYHLWYVYMLIGLYFIIPVVGRFVRAATEREILYFLVVWFAVISFTQPYLSRFWPQVDVRYFTGYIGYLVLGHYLAFKELPGKRNTTGLVIFYFLCLAGIAVGTYFTTASTGNISTLMYEPLGPFIILYAAGIFLLARITVYQIPGSLIRIRDLIGNYSLGIYLCHALFLTLLGEWNPSYKLCNPYLSIPLTALVCSVLSFVLIFLLSKIPYIGKYVAG